MRLWLGFWHGLTAFRMAVFNILFLLILALVIRLALFPADAVTLEEKTTLVIAPKGFIVEEYTGTPLERAINEALGQSVPETRMRDLLEGFRRAADDKRITQVLINTDQLFGVAPGAMDELAQAVERFRESGKQVIAYGGFLAQGQYYLAALADEVWLNHDGLVIIEGYGRYRNYFREALEKLDVDVNLFRVGEYKSAMEPYIRDDMSPEDREASEYLLGGLWQDYLEGVAMRRGLPLEVLVDITQNPARYLNEAGDDPAAMALDVGLVDRLMSRPEARSELASRGAPNEKGGFRQVSLRRFLHTPRRLKLRGDRIGVVVAQGVITEGDQPPGTIGAESTSRRIRQAVTDDNIKAVVLRIDSGGGSAFASEVIRREMVALREAGKPVVVSMGNVAASGGYWIAMGADEVWAYPTTITGSIGIFGFIPTFQDTLGRLGIYSDGVGTTPLAGAFRLDRELPEEARELVQSVIENGYRDFINLVAEYRELSPDEVDRIGQGRVWTGAQGAERGLIDQLGTLNEAIAAAGRIAGLGEDYEVVYIEPEITAWQKFLTRMGAKAISAAGVEMTPGWVSWLPRDLRARLEADLRLLAETTRRPGPTVVAHCLCEAPM